MITLMITVQAILLMYLYKLFKKGIIDLTTPVLPKAAEKVQERLSLSTV